MDENRIIEDQQAPVEPETNTAEAPKAEAEPKKGKKQKKSWKQELKEWVVALAVALVVVFIIQTLFFRIIRVDGQSMETTLHNGERLFVNVAELRFTGRIDRDSIVICHYPNRGWTYFVKRLVGVPGDTVYRENGVTHVVYEEDGQIVDNALDERYSLYYINGSPDDYEPYTLGDDEYFVVGDNRYNSHDSRDWKDGDDSKDVGPISKKMIIGKVQTVIWPLNAIRAAK